MKSLQVLVIDDELAVRQVLAAQLGDIGHQVEHVGTGRAAIDRLAKGDVDIALCDIRLPDVNGIEVMRQTLGSGVETTFLVMTAFASVSTAIDAMRSGAFDYLIKPVRVEDLKHRLVQVGEVLGLREENRRLRRMVPEPLDDSCVLPSEASQHINRMVSKVAGTEGTVLITGESGTGKGVYARRIHRNSLRARYPLVQVNCGAIPENLMETEFFGHLKGAFTGADRAKKGLFREADGGTLLLDEVAELPMALQVKLLHAIEEKQIRPVGGEQTRRVDVRMIAATNKSLRERVDDGRFREDLFYRLNVLQIHLPPLRERREDIPPLIAFFLASEPKRMAIDGNYSLDSEAMDALVNYAWPGNIRELQNVIDHALILAASDRITLSDLPLQVTTASSDGDPGVNASAGDDSLREQAHLFEVGAIRRAIEQAGGDRRLAAERLGIGLSTLYRKLGEEE
ncbi:MAG: response regulator [Proteobacteria bacterium]|nr:response regulator [Pseudomonadota bacterium]